MTRIQPVYVARSHDTLVVPGDLIQDRRGREWVYVAAEGPDYKIIAKMSPGEQNVQYEFDYRTFPGVEIVPKPSLSFDDELQLLLTPERHHSNAKETDQCE